jgi:hypothetical protein
VHLPCRALACMATCTPGMHALAGKAQTFNDLYELDTSNPEQYKWQQIACAQAPPPRARHSAVAVGGGGGGGGRGKGRVPPALQARSLSKSSA